MYNDKQWVREWDREKKRLEQEGMAKVQWIEGELYSEEENFPAWFLLLFSLMFIVLMGAVVVIVGRLILPEYVPTEFAKWGWIIGVPCFLGCEIQFLAKESFITWEKVETANVYGDWKKEYKETRKPYRSDKVQRLLSQDLQDPEKTTV